ncbi:TetR/AcrR family transcriptional regulator [Magnetospirillum sulfuroxidans]|uniref:TetR/AcrR family transcriptional regulator n=1 Tax=Magnetospirillum sulfuroxidans TaxID=611300 RepID=A0ABS5ICN1_9PROT|nr:TetR/AcrR family transcriptional regulator [Magnetospirillum sulfuroxidans]MBR9971498.1 TetR/AcrR family transcriptional regulator [Magnetospirillum sulfuroxidans]
MEMLPPRKRGRPPKASPAAIDTRTALVRTGVELLTEQGFLSTGIDQVLKRVGVPKGSFYHYFASKDDFGFAVIDAYGAYFAAKLDRWLTNPARLPLQRLADFVADAKAGMTRFDFRRGCLVGNLGQELGGQNDDFRCRLEAVMNDWQNRVAACLRDARAAGQIKADADCDRWAEFFWTGWEGAILRAKLTRSTRPLDLFTEIFFALLKE